ncbi:glyoxalase [Geodermatophilus sabuli]|uniref:Glyoxalase n=1 Tax=Geodermatophilus sabuli TaxID=1564158 RepID=A0A7K3VVX1_9ACTN|nr:VOC family protein [Geodermatophilus sabuli]NEK56789.1 glyoxalase [Geodermatophilus sabuli]
MPMLFVNLPVRDLTVARDFYGALGYRFHDHFSDEGTAAVVVADDIAVMLHTRDRFADLVAGKVGDPSRETTAVHSLSVESRAEVDDLVQRALDAGGKPWLPSREGNGGYRGSFTDPDGNVWEAIWLGQQHVIN